LWLLQIVRLARHFTVLSLVFTALGFSKGHWLLDGFCPIGYALWLRPQHPLARHLALALAYQTGYA
jgi:hypothetical protein